MSTTIQAETHEQFVKRMDVERSELGHEIRSGNYWRAASIAHHIREELASRARERNRDES